MQQGLLPAEPCLQSILYYLLYYMFDLCAYFYILGVMEAFLG